jgi:hypothetical protein
VGEVLARVAVHPDYHSTGAHCATNRRERRDMKSVDHHGLLPFRRSCAGMNSSEYPNPLGFGDSGLALDLSVGIR